MFRSSDVTTVEAGPPLAPPSPPSPPTLRAEGLKKEPASKVSDQVRP